MSNWEKILTDRLSEAGLDLPEGDWEALGARRTALARRKAWCRGLLLSVPAAAAAALALVFWLRTPSSGPAEPVASVAQEVSVVPEVSVAQEEPSVMLNGPVMLNEVKHLADAGTVVGTDPSATPQDDRKTPQDDRNAPQDDKSAPQDNRETTVPGLAPQAQEAPAAENPAKTFEDLLREEGRSATTRQRRRVTLGAGGLLASASASAQRSPSFAGDYGPLYAAASPAQATTANLTRVASMALAADQPVGEQHRRPLEFGVTAGIPLGGRWTVTTGLEYACYTSKFSSTVSGTKTQQAHYLGVPLRIDFNVLDTRQFRFYLGAGAKGDLGIAAHWGGERRDPDGFGFSLLAACGVQWDFTPLLGLYLEPRYSWFLSDPEGRLVTYRTQSPGQFNLSAGLRFNL